VIRDTAPLALDALAPEAAPGIRILPVVHERLEMTAVVRAVLDQLAPAGLALELPTTLEETVGRAVRRLPRISLIVSEEPGEEALVWVVVPGDPFVEALRWAAERERPVFFVDPDLPYREEHRDPVPDPYAIWNLGPEAYMGLLGASSGAAPVEDADRQREAGMAFHLVSARQKLPGGELLALVGAAHSRRLAAAVNRPVAHPFARVSRTSVALRHLHPGSLTGLLPDAPLAHAVWESVRSGEPPADTGLEETLSRRVSVIRYGLRVIAGQGGEDEARRRQRLVDYSCREGTREAWGDRRFPDRRALGRVVWKVGSGSYLEQTGEATGLWQRRLFFDYAERCARIQRQLVPGLYEWVTAARGVGDDNLAWELLDAARTYPWQGEQAEIETARIEGSDLDLGTRKIRFRRRFFRVKQRPVALPIRERPQPDDPAEWLRGFDGVGLCSHPPEDLVIEDYGRFLQRKAISILSVERRRVEPFAGSLLDGLDIRETLRNLHQDKVYVQEFGRVAGEAGSVVVIFDRDRTDDLYPFTMTWLGEHDQESDMAFYSTNPAEQVVGPGIMRATYGGFMLTLPRGRLFEVWQDRDYRFARDKGEVLIMAAVDYSLEKIVVHVAADTPTERERRYAAAQKKQLLHIPLASLSPVTLRKLRVLHILAGRDKRAIAKSYIW
jgi:hypothetical protein